MNFPRVAAAAGAGLLVYLALGTLFHAVLMADLVESLQRAGVARTESAIRRLWPAGLAGSVVGMLAFAYVYAKGYEGGPGLQEGLRFGVLVGLLFVALGTIRNYMSFTLPAEYLASAAVANIVQFAAVGMAVGLIYKPRARP